MELIANSILISGKIKAQIIYIRFILTMDKRGKAMKFRRTVYKEKYPLFLDWLGLLDILKVSSNYGLFGVSC